MVLGGFFSSAAVLASLVDGVLHLQLWPAVALVFALPALEASAFVGFVFPGEIAVLLGGVLAFRGHLPLGAALAAATLGAIAGDTVGYWVGKKWGRAILGSTLGRLPFIRHHIDRNLDRAGAYLRRRGPYAVVIGRFTAGLRVTVPGLAGMSGMHYPTFLAFNVLGGALWATTFVLLGFFGGAIWHKVERITSLAGVILLAIIVMAILVVHLVRRRVERADLANRD